MTVEALEDFLAWRTETLAESGFECRPIPFAESTHWVFEDGMLAHRTRGWFSIAGLAARARAPALDGAEQLIILQRQIALNAFLIRRTPAGAEVLFQGRVEPGNVDGMQLAPTVQSTPSNYQRLHGGAATPFVELFLEPDARETVLDELQSEEATRYLGKYNRNTVRCVRDPPPVPRGFRWYGLAALRRFVVSSNVLNTDARSVLAAVDWRELAAESGPFAGHPAGSVGAALRASYDAPPAGALEVVRWLSRHRAHAGLVARVVPLEALRGWRVEPDGIREIRPRLGFEARQFRVHARGREVAAWDQPLIDSRTVGRLSLVCQERGGLLRLLVKASHEIGFLEGVQLSASVSIPPGSAPGDDPVERRLIEIIDGGGAEVLHRCRQSEEGGRFYRDENDYEVVWLDPSLEVPLSDGYRWLTLSEVRALMRISGMFSIELRGVLALILAWL
jgi:oxidase EvaA